jgi:hypothetical protein
MTRWKTKTVRLLATLVLALSLGGCVDNLLAGTLVTVTQTFAATISAAVAAGVAEALVPSTTTGG